MQQSQHTTFEMEPEPEPEPEYHRSGGGSEEEEEELRASSNRRGEGAAAAAPAPAATLAVRWVRVAGAGTAGGGGGAGSEGWSRVGYQAWAVKEPLELSLGAQRVYGEWVTETFCSLYPADMIVRAINPRDPANALNEYRRTAEEEAASNPAELVFSRRGGALSEHLLHVPPMRSSQSGSPPYIDAEYAAAE